MVRELIKLLPCLILEHSSLVGGHLDHTNSSNESLKLARGEKVDVDKVASKNPFNQDAKQSLSEACDGFNEVVVKWFLLFADSGGKCKKLFWRSDTEYRKDKLMGGVDPPTFWLLNGHAVN